MSLAALVVDDSMLIRHTVCRFLEERGFAVDSASNGQEALQMLEQKLPDLIVTDMQMPEMGGGEFITALKSRPQTAAIPIIILTGRKSSPTKIDESLNASIIYKDININEQLGSAVDAIFRDRTRATGAGS
jgi:CheY-like chemotaxis protein